MVWGSVKVAIWVLVWFFVGSPFGLHQSLGLVFSLGLGLCLGIGLGLSLALVISLGHCWGLCLDISLGLWVLGFGQGFSQ